MKQRSTKSTDVPTKLRGDPPARRQRAQEAQTRKVLGRHYAAKYRAGKGR